MLCNSWCHRHGLVRACCGDWWCSNKKLPRALASWRGSCAVAGWGSAPCVDRLRLIKYWIMSCSTNPSKNADVFSLNFVGISPHRMKFKESSLLHPMQPRLLQAGASCTVTLCLALSGNTQCMPGMPKGRGTLLGTLSYFSVTQLNQHPTQVRDCTSEACANTYDPLCINFKELTIFSPWWEREIMCLQQLHRNRGTGWTCSLKDWSLHSKFWVFTYKITFPLFFPK